MQTQMKTQVKQRDDCLVSLFDFCLQFVSVCESLHVFIHVLSEQKIVSAFLFSKCNAMQKPPATLLVALKQMYQCKRFDDMYADQYALQTAQDGDMPSG